MKDGPVALFEQGADEGVRPPRSNRCRFIFVMTHDENKGKYFKHDDYAGPYWRLAIISIDIVVLILLSVLFIIASSILMALIDIPLQWFFFAWLFLCFFYLGPIHSMGIGTIGFKLTGFRLVDQNGQRPSVWRTIIRCGYLLLSPSYYLVDALCTCSPYTRQTIWDKGADTVVVLKEASPIGTISLRYSLEFFLGQCHVFREPVIPKE